MKSFHIKSILLGIGIGAILTSIIGMVFMAGFNPNNAKLTNEQIIEKAKVLGMIEVKSILGEENPGDAKLESEGTDLGIDTKNKINETTQEATKKVQEVVATPIPKQPETEVQVEVVKGDTSEKVADKLLKVNLISDKKVFIDELTKQGLTMEINIGQYKIKPGINIKEIIKMLTTIG